MNKQGNEAAKCYDISYTISLSGPSRISMQVGQEGLCFTFYKKDSSKLSEQNYPIELLGRNYPALPYAILVGEVCTWH